MTTSAMEFGQETINVVLNETGQFARFNAAGTALVVNGRPAYQQRHDGSVAAYGKWGQPPAWLKGRLFSSDKAVVPFDGSVTLTQNFNTGGTISGSLDSAVTFAGRPTYKAVVGGGTGTNFQLGVSTANLTIPPRARTFATKGFVLAIKPPSGVTCTGVVLYTGDLNYSTAKTRQVAAATNPLRVYHAADGWAYLYFAGDTEDAAYLSGSDIDSTFATAVQWKIRVDVGSAGAQDGTWYVGGLFAVSAAQVPVVLFTVDDGYDELYSFLAPACKERGIPLSLSIDAGYIDTAGYMTTAQLADLMADESGLFEATNHAKNNGPFGTVGLTQYLANMAECDALLASVGAPENGRKCAVYVGGSYDSTLISALRGLGYRAGRTVGASTGQFAHGPIAAWHGDEMFAIPALCNLQTGVSVSTVIGYIETAKARNSAVCAIMGHQFLSAAATLAWVAGYDPTYGVLNLLDYLADERDAGNILMPGYGNWAAGVWDASRTV